MEPDDQDDLDVDEEDSEVARPLATGYIVFKKDVTLSEFIDRIDTGRKLFGE